MFKNKRPVSELGAKFFLISTLIVIAPAYTLAQSPSSTVTTSDTVPAPSPGIKFSGSMTTRYDSRDDGATQKLQAGIVLGLTVDMKDQFKLVAIATTGTKYASTNYTYFDLKTGAAEASPAAFYFRQLYLTKTIGNTQISAGALPALDRYGAHTGFGKNGFVDGARVNLNTSAGVLGVTAGSLSDMNNLDIIHRNRKLNYIEVYVQHDFAKKLFTELSFGEVDSDTFIRLAVKEDFKVFSDRVITLIAEGLENRHQGETQISAALTVNSDLTSLLGLAERYRGLLDINLRYSYGDRNVGVRGLVGDDLFMTGNDVRFGFSGKLNKASTIGWNTSLDAFRENPGTRFQAGLRARIP